jgi:hypothetical protein
MAGAPSDYNRGEMDIAEQVSTFNFVMGMTKWGSLAVASLLALFVLWFCTPAGFTGGAAAAIVMAVLGVTFLKGDKEAAAH